MRDWREGKDRTFSRSKIFNELQQNFPQDWLLSVELYELALQDHQNDLAKSIVEHLNDLKKSTPEVGHLIDDGLLLAKQLLVQRN